MELMIKTRLAVKVGERPSPTGLKTPPCCPREHFCTQQEGKRTEWLTQGHCPHWEKAKELPSPKRSAGHLYSHCSHHSQQGMSICFRSSEKGTEFSASEITSNKPDKDSKRKGKSEVRNYFYRKKLRLEATALFESCLTYKQWAQNGLLHSFTKSIH